MAIDRRKEIQELEAQIEYIKSVAFAPGFGKVLTPKGKTEQIADLERRIAVQRQLLEKETCGNCGNTGITRSGKPCRECSCGIRVPD